MTLKTTVGRNCLVLFALIFSSQVSAEGDAQAGKITAYTCTGCHGIADYSNVYPTYKVPKLGGQNATYIINALKAYQTGDRNHPTMSNQAASLSQQDIEDVAAYLSGFTPKTTK